MNDEDQIIAKAQNGDSVAFGVLYDRYSRQIYRFVFLKIGHVHDTEDLTHQVFLNAWQNIQNYRFQGFPFSSWLYRIAHNAVIDFYRTRKQHVDIEMVAEDAVYDFPDHEESIDRKNQLETVRAFLVKLETDQQSVLVMKFVNDLSNKEIAGILGKSEGAVRVIQHRALKQLKGLIEEHERANH